MDVPGYPISSIMSTTELCPYLPNVPESLTWENESAFASALTLSMLYLQGAQEKFRPGQVRIGWDEKGMLILADLTDDEVVGTATQENQRLWQLGDVFEVFWRDLSGEDYYELHTEPSNYHLQLHFPSAKTINLLQTKESLLSDLFVTEPLLTSRTRKTSTGWQVLERIFWPKGHPPDEALISFSRYDYTASLENPILSSTSPHEVVSYHRQEEWRKVRFVRPA